MARLIITYSDDSVATIEDDVNSLTKYLLTLLEDSDIRKQMLTVNLS